ATNMKRRDPVTSGGAPSRARRRGFQYSRSPLAPDRRGNPDATNANPRPERETRRTMIKGRYPDRKQFPQPPEGEHVGVLVDVVDLGEVKTAFGIKFRVRLHFQIEA